jgi:6-phosphogluconolactonase (cycloisomerase 2 family)
MRKANWAWAVLVAGAVLLGGCKNFWAPPASTTTTTTTTTLNSGYFFILDPSTSEIISYNIVSGVLTKINAYDVPAAPLAIAIAPNKNFLYVSSLSGIFVYTVSGGVLTKGNNGEVISLDSATAMAVDSTSSWLIEASGSAGNLYAISVDPSSGLLTSTTESAQPVPLTGTAINQVTISPNNQFVFVAAGANGTYAYSFNAASTGNPFASAAYDLIGVKNSSAGTSVSVAVDPSNRLLYVGEVAAVSSGGGLRAFTIASNGALAEIAGSPYASGGTGPYSILPKSTNDTVYVANWKGTSAGNITGFSISSTNSVYGLTQLSSTATTGIRPMAITEDSEENFVLVESAGGSPYFSAYVFDTTTASQLDLTITDSTFAGATLAAEQY